MSLSPTAAPTAFEPPTLVPTLLPTEEPTSVNDLYKNARWRDILIVFYYQLLFGGILFITFEVSAQ